MKNHFAAEGLVVDEGVVLGVVGRVAGHEGDGGAVAAHVVVHVHTADHRGLLEVDGLVWYVEHSAPRRVAHLRQHLLQAALEHGRRALHVVYVPRLFGFYVIGLF